MNGVRTDQPRVVSIGEVLWDELPDGSRHIGGAPFNFACHCRALGASVTFISRAGTDDSGSDLVHRAAEMGIATDFIQRDRGKPTGTVRVRLTEDGGAEYAITDDVAWDHIVFGDRERAAVDQADILYFGTLAQRHPKTHAAITAAVSSVARHCLVVCDVNLREGWYDREIIRKSFEAAGMVKAGGAELRRIGEMLGIEGDEAGIADGLMREFGLWNVVVTHGKDGAVSYVASPPNAGRSDWKRFPVASYAAATFFEIGREREWCRARDEFHAAPVRHEVAGVPVNIADTVGAGDAFLAAYVLALAEKEPVESALERANFAGAWVATRHGATPELDRNLLERFGRDHRGKVATPSPKVKPVQSGLSG